MTRVFRAVVVLALLVTVCACQSTKLEGEKFYIRGGGRGTAYLQRDVNAVYHAAVATLRDDLAYEMESQKLEGDRGTVKARTASARRVRIEIYAQGEGQTKMDIYMGPDTSDLVVRQVMSKIEARLQ